MMERQITAALQAEVAAIQPSPDLLDRIKQEAAKPARLSFWRNRLGVQVAAAALLVMPLLGFAIQQIWVVPAKPPSEAPPAQRPVQEMELDDLLTAADFPVRLPRYLPEGATLFASVLAGDADPTVQVIEISYIKEGMGHITIAQWRGDAAAPFPPGHPFPGVLDTEPWHRTLGVRSVELDGREVQLLSYIISGMSGNRLYWHEQGVNYVVAASGRYSVAELLQVAASLQDEE